MLPCYMFVSFASLGEVAGGGAASLAAEVPAAEVICGRVRVPGQGGYLRVQLPAGGLAEQHAEQDQEPEPRREPALAGARPESEQEVDQAESSELRQVPDPVGGRPALVVAGPGRDRGERHDQDRDEELSEDRALVLVAAARYPGLPDRARRRLGFLCCLGLAVGGGLLCDHRGHTVLPVNSCPLCRISADTQEARSWMFLTSSGMLWNAMNHSPAAIVTCSIPRARDMS